MKRILKIFICFALVFVSCFAMVGCGDNKPPEPSENWTDVVVNSTNCTDYFTLDSYLYYKALNSDFYFSDLSCNDSIYKKGEVNSNYYIDEFLVTDEFGRPTLKSIFSDSSSHLEQDKTRWKAIGFKATKDMLIKSIEFTIDRAEGIIINAYDISFIIQNGTTTKEYCSGNAQTEGYRCTYTFSSFWYPTYADIIENSYIFVPKDSIISIVFNDINLINHTYSKELSDQNGSSSNKYSTDEERTLAKNEAKKCFDLQDIVIKGQSK